MTLNKEGKEIIIKRVLAKQNGVEDYDIEHLKFAEKKLGVSTAYIIKEELYNTFLTWWYIIMNT